MPLKKKNHQKARKRRLSDIIIRKHKQNCEQLRRYNIVQMLEELSDASDSRVL